MVLPDLSNILLNWYGLIMVNYPTAKEPHKGVVAYLLLVEAFVIFDRHLIT